jgi:tetratricopeptide (TPR) repeat protein
VATVDAPLCLGRSDELARLRRTLRDALEGRGGLVLVTGDAGIGKTRLVETCAADAERAGAAVAWGRCWEAGGAPAYWPWIEALRALDADVAGLGEPTAGADGEDRFALFDRVAQVLLRAAAERPLVIVLEDLHAADPTSLLLLELLAPRLRAAALLVLATYRVADPGTDRAVERLLAGLSRRGDQVALGGLDLDATRELAKESTGVELPEATVAELRRRTEGNPFFVQALAGVLASGPGGSEPLPAGVQQAIGRRLDPLTPGTRATLAAAAVLGRDFGVARVARLRGVSPDEALGLLEPALRAGIVTHAGAEGDLRFTHALIRDVLHTELEPSERAELHRREADALEPQAARDAELLPELAHHRVAAVPVGDVGAALTACERAAAHALASLAFEDAAALLQRGLRLADRALEPLSPSRRVALLLALGDAHMRAGDTDAAHEAFAQAANVARANGMSHELAHAALGYGGVVVRPGETDETLLALLEQALEQVADDEQALRARLLGRLARELHFSPTPARARSLAAEAVTLAEADGDPAVRAYALTAWHISRALPETVDERLEASTRVIELAREAGDLERELDGRTLRAGDLLELGRPGAAAEELDAAELVAARLRQPALTWRVLLIRGTLALLAGRFDEAERLIAEAYDVGRRSRGRAAYRYRVLQESELRYLRGGLAELEPEARTLSEEAPAVWGFSVVHLLAMTGRLEEARPGFELKAVAGFGGPVDDMAALGIIARYADVCCALGDAERAGILYERLLPHADRWLVAAGGVCTGTVRLRLGPLAATMGRLEEAAGHLEAAVRAHRDAGAVPVTALAEVELAEVLRRLGDGPRADELTGHALRTARALGMRPLVERVEAGVVPAAAAPAAEAALEREGEYWVARFAGRDVRLRDRKGIGYLARLVEHPHRELSALELAGAGPEGDAGELLDADAKRAYRSRLEELREEIDEAERWNDPERVERASAELEFVSSELSRAVGLGGRDRRAASSAERARVSVTRAIRSAIASVEAEHPELGSHLAAAVRTGTHCRYAPEAGEEVAWRVDRG